MKILALAALAFALTGCGTMLRAPICAKGEYELPPGAAGRYRLAMVESSPLYSGSLTGMAELQFEIRDDDAESFGLIVPQAMTSRLKAFLGMRSRRSVANSSDDPLLPTMLVAVCKIGGIYYTQSEDGDGTFSVSRFDVSPTGLTTTALRFDPKELTRADIGTFFLPQLDSVDEKGKWQFDFLERSRLIVDNAGFDETRREKLISLGHPVFTGTVFSRVPTHEAKSLGKTVRVALPKRRS